jgi:quercetin dioxygenase-like cupin family protein
MKRLLAMIALLGAFGTAAVALASTGAGKITEKILGAGAVADPYTIHVTEPGDVIVAKATVPPGASFGWHSHRVAVAAVVTSGTLTLYDGAARTCTPHRYAAGQGFTEQPDHVHMARNEGRKTVVLLVTYLGLKHGVNPDVPAASPGNCPF